MSTLDVDALLGAAYQDAQNSLNSSSENNRKRPRSDSRERERERREQEERDQREREEKERERRKRKRRAAPPKSPSPDETLDPRALAEQNARTVFAGGLPLNYTRPDLMPFFEQAGPVKDISLVYERNSKKSKGLCYVEYADIKSVATALCMTGTFLNGHKIVIKSVSLDPRPTQISSLVAPLSTQVYFTNIDERITEDDIDEFFYQVGDTDGVYLQKDPHTRKSLGRGNVTFKNPEDAKKAIEVCNGFLLMKKPMKVSASASILNVVKPPEPVVPLMGTVPIPGMMPTVINPLMTPGGAPPMVPVGTPSTPTSTCVILKNMFDPSEADEDPNFDVELKEEIRQECSKFGPLKNVIIDKNSMGFVYLEYAAVESATKAIAALNGRWFDGKAVSAEYLPESVFRARMK